MKILIFDPIGEVSEDMILASLIHLGYQIRYLKETVSKIGIEKYRLKTSLKVVNGIVARGLKIAIPEEERVRSYTQIKEVISKSTLSENIKEKTLNVLDFLAQDEHFQSVGALDSILNVVGIAAAIEWFQIEKIFTRAIPVGVGMKNSMHGLVPIPTPATVRLLGGLRIKFTEVEAELATPIGVAVIKTFSEKATPPSDMVIIGSGYGCGDRKIEGWPNLFRLILCEVEQGRTEQAYVIETDIDDMSPEEFEGVSKRLFQEGALDVNFTQKIMKRGRPGVGISVISKPLDLQKLLNILLTYTSSIGARYYPVEKKMLQKRQFSVKTKYGDVDVKEVVTPDGKTRFKPEYRDMQEISIKNDLLICNIRKEVEKILEAKEK